jgi:hypothetical protein
MRNAYKILVGNPEWKRPLGRPRCRWKILAIMEGVDWIYVTQNRDQWQALVNMVMTIRIPYTAQHFLTS